MNDTPAIQSNAISDKTPSASNPIAAKSIVSIPIPGAPKSNVDADKAIQEKAVAAIAKSYEAIVDKIIGVVDGAGVRLITKRARRTMEKAEAEELGQSVHITPESKETAKVAASRIAARRVKNPEVMDWAAIGAVMTDWLSGISAVVGELREREARQLKMNGATNGNTRKQDENKDGAFTAEQRR